MKSEWGWTAVDPTGLPLAHSKNRALLEEYLADCDDIELEELL